MILRVADIYRDNMATSHDNLVLLLVTLPCIYWHCLNPTSDRLLGELRWWTYLPCLVFQQELAFKCIKDRSEIESLPYMKSSFES